MICLLDVNALIAFGLHKHDHHYRVAHWLAAQDHPSVHTCSITELGFVRILSQVSAYAMTVPEARKLLMEFKLGSSPAFHFLPDDHDISHLPAWAKSPKQITDAHLLELAAAHGAVLATLHERIPGAYIIP
jgi:predicted nucleic acid-binding protein